MPTTIAGYVFGSDPIKKLNLPLFEIQSVACRLAAKQFTDRPILVGEDEQADLSDFDTNSTKSTTGCLESRQTSLDTTISSSSNPQVDCKGSRAAKLHENDTFVTEIAHGDLSESQDNSTDSNNDDSDSDSDDGSETESEFDDRPAQKKRKIDNPQARTLRDDLLAIGDPILEGADCQDPYGGQDHYDESMKLLATASDDEPIDSELKEDSDVISAPQSHEND